MKRYLKIVPNLIYLIRESSLPSITSQNSESEDAEKDVGVIYQPKGKQFRH